MPGCCHQRCSCKLFPHRSTMPPRSSSLQLGPRTETLPPWKMVFRITLKDSQNSIRSEATEDCKGVMLSSACVWKWISVLEWHTVYGRNPAPVRMAKTLDFCICSEGFSPPTAYSMSEKRGVGTFERRCENGLIGDCLLSWLARFESQRCIFSTNVPT